MKLLTLFFSVILLTVADLATIRQKYINAATSPKETQELYTLLEKTPDDSVNSTFVAYKATALMLKAKYESGLFHKKRLFTEGANLLDAVIKRDANNYEARVLRLAIQENAPKITGYYDEIDNDKTFIVKNFGTQKSDLKVFTRGFIKNSKSFTKEEKAAF